MCAQAAGWSRHHFLECPSSNREELCGVTVAKLRRQHGSSFRGPPSRRNRTELSEALRGFSELKEKQ